jgi:tol-pal system-associated acyl-CoA thioesterase
MSEVLLQVRVYLEDTDAQGVVYNAGYFRFMERARTEWLRARGIDHRALMERDGLQLVLHAIEMKFTAPARLDDLLCVAAEVREMRGARVTFAQSVRRNDAEGELLCVAQAEVACVDVRGQRPRRLPAALTDGWKE